MIISLIFLGVILYIYKKGLKYLFVHICQSVYILPFLFSYVELNVKNQNWKHTIHSSTLTAPGWCEVHLFPVEKSSHLNPLPPLRSPSPRPIRARTYLMGLQRKLCGAKQSQIETSHWNNTLKCFENKFYLPYVWFPFIWNSGFHLMFLDKFFT